MCVYFFFFPQSFLSNEEREKRKLVEYNVCLISAPLHICPISPVLSAAARYAGLPLTLANQPV